MHGRSSLTIILHRTSRIPTVQTQRRSSIASWFHQNLTGSMKRNIARLPLEVPYEMSSSGYALVTPFTISFTSLLSGVPCFSKPPSASLPNYPGYTYCNSNWNTIGYSDTQTLRKINNLISHACWNKSTNDDLLDCIMG